jgi:ribonucleotide reductase alpha subunit
MSSNQSKMYVIKRKKDEKGDYFKEPIHFDKITNRINKLINKNEKGRVDAIFITQKVINNIYSGITTEEIDIETANICANLATTDYLYSQLGGRILVSNLHKKTLNSFVDKMNKINDELPDLLNQKWLKWVNNNKVELENAINYNNDFNYDFFGFKTLERAYLIKNQQTKYIYERPQDVLMRVASFINMGDINATINCYNQMSSKNYTHATPTLFNSGTKRPQLSSCFLLPTYNDSVDGIYKTITDCAKISKWAGGIGLHVSNVRSKGTQIRGTNGTSNGIIPMLQVYNATARYIDQGGGKRKGSIAIYLEPHHPDIYDFLELKKNTGSELDRARDLFLALWVSDLFMECVRDDKDWYLMDPDECPNLNEVYGDEYKQLYQKYVDENKYRRKVKARDLMEKIMESQLETGVPYMSYKDNVNKKSNQKNIGIIKSSNLCVAGDTLLKTFEGDFPIKTLENQNVKVWNGVEWSDTIVKKTGENKQLRKITFKLQSIKPIPQQQSNITRISLLRMTFSETYVTLYCTDYHKFYILDELNKEKEIRAFELQPGHKLYQFKNYNDENNMINTKPLVEVISNEITDRYEDVYCVNEPLRHRAVFNGILTGNCNEIVEVSNNEEHAVCNLASIAVNQFLVPFKSRRQWTIYTKENCQYCKWAKKYFDNKGFKYTEKTEIDNEVRKMITSNLQKNIECDGDTCTVTSNNGKITLPQIFYGKQYIGGFEEMVKYTADDYDFNALGECAYTATKNLDRVIDVNYYPTLETKCSNMRNRPIGLGIQGLADTLAKMKINFDSDEAVKFNSKMMEYIYYYSLKASNDIAKSRYEMIVSIRNNLNNVPEYYDEKYYISGKLQIDNIPLEKNCLENEYYHQLRLTNRELQLNTFYGAYSSYEGSPMSQGLLQFDMWDGLTLSKELDWDGLRKSISEYGVRNSLVTALMPTASTSQILGNNECFEWFTNNIYSRNTLAGNFPVVNKHLMEDMILIDEWDNNVKDIIIASDGSVKNVPNMPNIYRNLYKTIWEIKQIWVLKNAHARAPFIDQTQSMNIFMAKPDYKKLNSCHMWGWKNGLKTGMYYLRSKAAKEAIKFTVDPKLLQNLEEEECFACSA